MLSQFQVYCKVIFPILFNYRLLQDTEYSSLCYTIDSCVCAFSVTQSYDPIDCSLPDSCPWDFSGKNIGGDCHFLVQGFLRDLLNPGIEPSSLMSLELTDGFFITSATREAPEQDLIGYLFYMQQYIYANPNLLIQQINFKYLFTMCLVERYCLDIGARPPEFLFHFYHLLVVQSQTY